MDPGDFERRPTVLLIALALAWMVAGPILVADLGGQGAGAAGSKLFWISPGEPANAESLPTGPVTIDFDLAPGDQGQTTVEKAFPGKRYQLQLAVADAPIVDGWSVYIQYDPSQVRYATGSFQASEFIPGLVGMVNEKETSVGVGGVALGRKVSNSGDGVLGTLVFEIQEGFSGSAQLIVSQVSFHRLDRVADKRDVSAVATLTKTGILIGDFDGNGRVDYQDFFLFADNFGSTAPWFDLNGNGRVDYDDFFMFADNFGKADNPQ
jgi:hypothetical protein